MFILLKPKPINSKTKETDHSTVVKFFPELHVFIIGKKYLFYYILDLF